MSGVVTTAVAVLVVLMVSCLTAIDGTATEENEHVYEYMGKQSTASEGFAHPTTSAPLSAAPSSPVALLETSTFNLTTPPDLSSPHLNSTRSQILPFQLRFPEPFIPGSVHALRAKSPIFNDSCSCGKRLSINRIVGGHVTLVNEYPWQAALSQVNAAPFCGGTLITDRHVVTAAHCLILGPPSFVVRLREHNVTDPASTNTLTRNVSKKEIHQHYDAMTHVNDIAMLTLSEPVPISPNLLPACLPSDSTTLYSNKTATVSGWGTTSSVGFTSPVLMAVDVPVWSPSACKKHSNYLSTQIFNRMLCAGSAGIDSCKGDSGGPLVYNKNETYELIGVVSFGQGCALDGYPGVYTRVNKFLKWIRTKSLGGSFCRGFTFPF